VLTCPKTEISWTYASDGQKDHQPRNVVVDREVARICAAKAREEALEMNRTGQFAEAHRPAPRYVRADPPVRPE
jgi:hypothetical protein